MLKGSRVPVLVLEAKAGASTLTAEIRKTIQTNAEFYAGAAVVIDTDETTPPSKIAPVLQEVRALGLIPVGVRGSSETASALDLPSFGTAPLDPEPPARAPTARPAPGPQAATKILHQTIRSGMQVTAPEGDVIIFGNVAPGAEISAAGSILVYGALRGRAHAGMHGAGDAVIVADLMDAQLVSIAGNYLERERMDEAVTKGRGLVRRSGEFINITSL